MRGFFSFLWDILFWGYFGKLGVQRWIVLTSFLLICRRCRFYYSLHDVRIIAGTSAESAAFQYAIEFWKRFASCRS